MVDIRQDSVIRSFPLSPIECKYQPFLRTIHGLSAGSNFVRIRFLVLHVQEAICRDHRHDTAGCESLYYYITFSVYILYISLPPRRGRAARFTWRGSGSKGHLALQLRHKSAITMKERLLLTSSFPMFW